MVVPDPGMVTSVRLSTPSKPNRTRLPVFERVVKSYLPAGAMYWRVVSLALDSSESAAGGVGKTEGSGGLGYQ